MNSDGIPIPTLEWISAEFNWATWAMQQCESRIRDLPEDDPKFEHWVRQGQLIMAYMDGVLEQHLTTGCLCYRYPVPLSTLGKD